MKTLNITFEDHEFQSLLNEKMKTSWHDFIIEMRFHWERGLRCGNCINYFCDEYNGDQCEIHEFELRERKKCKDFKSLKDVNKK
jgi:hypothetical protein